MGRVLEPSSNCIFYAKCIHRMRQSQSNDINMLAFSWFMHFVYATTRSFPTTFAEQTNERDTCAAKQEQTTTTITVMFQLKENGTGESGELETVFRTHSH